MSVSEIRSVIAEYLQRAMVKRKELIAINGPIKGWDLKSIEGSLSLAEYTLENDDYDLGYYPEVIEEKIKKMKLPMKEGEKEWDIFRRQYVLGERDFWTALLAYNKSGGEVYSFSHNVIPSLSKPDVNKKKLVPTIEAYIDERLSLKEWTPKSAKAYRSQFELLIEYLGPEAALYISSDAANAIKLMLRTIPKNRSNGVYKGLSLTELVKEIPPEKRMSPRTVNKYLHTYSAFYDWAMDRSDTSENNFKKITLTLGNDEQPRDAFTHEQLIKMLGEIQNNAHGLINKNYQKWGVLIGLYTGARLNEIAQLELTDIRKEDGIWCFDINDIGDDTKRLKNKASKRLVPIHSHLLAWGLVEYADSLRAEGKNRFFHELTHDRNNGFGRNLSQWFNNRFLVKLGLKSKRLVFHSFRHTFSTLLIRAGVEEPLAQEIIGHTKVGTMQITYFKGYSLKQRQEALEKILQDLPLPQAK